MTTMDTLLCNDPEVKRMALAALEECCDLQAFGRKVLEAVLNAAMSAKADEACNAAYGERDPERSSSRNGYRPRRLVTQAGELSLRIPKLRSGSFFPEDVIERYCRVDRALVACVAEMYVMGVSTRKVEAVAGELGVSSMSKSQVSRLCEVLDAEVAAFRSQRFDGTRFAYLYLDATYVKCRVDGRSSSQAVVTAIGVDETGHKRFVGVDCIDTESHADWKAFLGDLRARGVESGREGVRLVVSDEHAGLVRAVEETFQGAAHQRCITHLMRNVSGHIRKKADQKRAREALKAVFAQKSALMVRACYQQATEEVLKMSKAAGEVLLEAEDDALAYLFVPEVALAQDQDQQRAGARQPRDQAAHARRAVVPFPRLARPLGHGRAHRSGRGVVGPLHDSRSLALARMEARGARGPDGGGGPRRQGRRSKGGGAGY